MTPSTSFEISTGPGSYYPPGTEFDIEVEVTNANGDISIVRTDESVEYLDPEKPWQRVAGNGYTVVYYGVENSVVNDLVAETNSRIDTLVKVLGVDDAPDFKAVVFPSVRDATPSFPPVSQTATDQFLRAFDTSSGEELWRGRLPASGQASPMTYRLSREGRQYVVIAAGGHGIMRTAIGDSVIAFALPNP